MSGGSGGTSYWPLVVCSHRWVIGNNVTPPWLIFKASRGASRPCLTPARDRCKWWLGRGEWSSWKQPRKHIWRRLKTGSECRLQVSEDSCRVPWLRPSFYLRILPSYRVTSRILFLDYTQRGILFPTVKIRWQSGSHRTWGLMGERWLCDRLLDDSAEQSLEERHSAWQPLRGRSRRIAIDFLFQKQHKACPQQAQLLKSIYAVVVTDHPKLSPGFQSISSENRFNSSQWLIWAWNVFWLRMLGKYGVVKRIICSDRSTTAAANCRKDSW